MTVFSRPNQTDADPLGAFMDHGAYSVHGYEQPIVDGPLSGLTLGVKDLYDVAGLPTGAGSPDWLGDAGPALRHAPSVEKLLAAGARFVGKTLTDEIAWSLNGENAHYGTPVNPAAEGRIPGGSSAGSAVAVAGGLIDIGLGSDTGGSVRLPASYCGVWGLRPTHGRIDIGGAVALAPSFDTVGWFSSKPDVFSRVGPVLLPESDNAHSIDRLLMPRDVWARLSPHLHAEMEAKARALAERLRLPLEETVLAPDAADVGDLPAWRKAFQVCQSAEAWEVHGAWVQAKSPKLGPGIKDRFAFAAGLASAEVAAARTKREAISDYLQTVVVQGTVLVIPGAADIAPPRGLSGPVLDDIRMRALDMLSPAGLGRLPQLAVPAVKTHEGPIGLGLIGWSGADEALLSLVQNLADL